MVTAETAVALPVVILILAICLGALRLGADQLRCIDAARAGARAAARGDTPAAVREVAERAAPPRSQIGIERIGDDTVVTVQGPAAPGVPLTWAVPAPRATAVLPVEGAS